MATGKINVTADNIFPIIKKFLYSDHEIFLRELVSNAVDASSKLKTLSSLGEVKGDVGNLRVEVKLDKESKTITISDNGERDTLYVSIHLIHKICKYNGKDGTKPKIFKLGSGAWKKIKLKAKSRVKQVAFNLIEAYAKRKLKKGFQYGPDSSIQHELEASFIYEDKPTIN